MASKAGESSSAQTGSDALYCKWGPVSYNNLVQEYNIRPEWNPVLPSKEDMAFLLKEGKITLFSDFFKFCNFRLPITKFCKSVLDYYPIHISQLHPSGLVKLRHFEFACIALGHIPEITVFRAFSFSGGKWEPRTSSRTMVPLLMLVENALFKRLCQCPSECTVILEGALVMAGMSLLWQDIRLYPSFQRDDEGRWSLFDFIDPPRNAALRAADRVLGEQEPDVLKIHLEQFLLPAVPTNPTAYISQPPPVEGVVFLLQRRKNQSG
ncbi:hypothetical protein Hanom_Chr11g01014061 [Helianthus anomalus]